MSWTANATMLGVTPLVEPICSRPRHRQTSPRRNHHHFVRVLGLAPNVTRLACYEVIEHYMLNATLHGIRLSWSLVLSKNKAWKSAQEFLTSHGFLIRCLRNSNNESRI